MLNLCVFPVVLSCLRSNEPGEVWHLFYSPRQDNGGDEVKKSLGKNDNENEGCLRFCQFDQNTFRVTQMVFREMFTLPVVDSLLNNLSLRKYNLFLKSLMSEQLVVPMWSRAMCCCLKKAPIPNISQQ